MSSTPTASSGAGLPSNSYIYKIINPLATSALEQLTIISSDDSLRYLNPATLAVLPDGNIEKVNEKVTCLERANDAPGNVVTTAGRDGFIRFWDNRSRRKALEIESPHKLISALVCDAQKNFIAAGIENPEDGPNVSPIYVWDQRNPAAPTLSLVESHTDTVTSLQLHPNHPALLLSSSTDGLINIFDTSQADEEDALYQVINHRSAIAHAGFMFPSTDIYALGTDETMSFHALQSQEEEKEEPMPKAFGDVREALGCEYLVKMHWVGSQPYVAAGKHSDNRFDLIPITKASNGPLDYGYDLGKSIRFQGAHDDEIVRDLFTDTYTRTTYTCGEDGQVRSWKLSEDESMDIDEEDPSTKKTKDKKEKRKDKKEKRKAEDKRFKPY